jgi:hypothetical protein
MPRPSGMESIRQSSFATALMVRNCNKQAVAQDNLPAVAADYSKPPARCVADRQASNKYTEGNTMNLKLSHRSARSPALVDFLFLHYTVADLRTVGAEPEQQTRQQDFAFGSNSFFLRLPPRSDTRVVPTLHPHRRSDR